ncbi:hypothetical protein Lnau_3097 [Legionella nautarum]|uniref:Uncharacterized protein n=1 Tax=Legionella nautarum TaxID=45070 RepID=A0A0W0WIN3_9GAMM|nr:hypothetical protein [Legionella nautarum]KTD32186.1 hypothetical protein Lnau_3097 [Legionella nautarum]
MTIRTIKNVPHDLLPIIRDISDQITLLRSVKSAIDHKNLLDAAENNAFLIEKYLLTLDKEAQQNNIEKAKI